VLDLGSGAGFDALLAAHVVGPTGRVVGIDMTPEMLARADANAQKAGVQNVEFRRGYIEALPVEDASVDVVISNCVINLSPEKARVFAEAHRVLRPGGRLAISDLVLKAPCRRDCSAASRRTSAAWRGAMQRDEYLAAISSAGFERVEVVAEGSFAVGSGPPESRDTRRSRRRRTDYGGCRAHSRRRRQPEGRRAQVGNVYAKDARGTMTSTRLVSWFGTVSVILVFLGWFVAFFGLGIPPCREERAAPMGKCPLRRHHDGLGNNALLPRARGAPTTGRQPDTATAARIVVWLAVEAVFSARYGVWFNVGVDAGVLALFTVPLVATMRATDSNRAGRTRV
jgi:SAM-dependent methyltransferase